MSATGRTVLVVDDDRAIRVVLRQLLEYSGYEVIECGDANEALTVVDRRAGAISILIADYAIPGMSGLALAREVARTAPWIHTLIISGHQTPERECRRTVGVSFLAKPFGTADLLSAFRTFETPRPMRARATRVGGSVQLAI